MSVIECWCGKIMLNIGRDTGSLNWNPDCPLHGRGTAWFSRHAWGKDGILVSRGEPDGEVKP